MSYELIAALRDMIVANASITAILATDADTGGPAVYPAHRTDVANPVYPMITLARIGDGMDSGKFDEYAPGQFDYPRFAIDAWSKGAVDGALAVMRLVDQMLRGRSIQSQYISSYRVMRTLFKDDLFDVPSQAFQVHSEWKCWTQLTQGTSLPIPS